jgi:hypothetical protein
MRRIVALVFAPALVLTACGDDGDGSDRDAVIERLEAEGETPESAACFADELSDYSLADIEAFIDGEGGVPGLDDAVREAAEICADTTGGDGPAD